MRVLHLPVNNGSRTSHTVRALRQQGVEAVGLVRASASIQSPEGLKIINLGSKLGSKYSPQLLLALWPWLYHFIKLVRWADVVHWYSGAMALPFGLDLAIVKQLGKPGLVEWQGVEIRIPEVEFAENPYYTAIFHNGYEYQAYESLPQSRRMQQKFANIGFACSAPIGMLQYVQPDIFPQPYVLPRRLILTEYEPIFPRADTARPLIIHSPSAPVGKGTSAVLKAVEQLKARCDFEFRLIQNMPRKEALQLMAQTDILLDQFVVGDFGSAALEAMALGKLVVCYIKPSLVVRYPADLPIVKATQETLVEVLEQLIKQPELRATLGQQGRAYIEKYHDACDVAGKLAQIYQELRAKQ